MRKFVKGRTNQENVYYVDLQPWRRRIYNLRRGCEATFLAKNALEAKRFIIGYNFRVSQWLLTVDQ